MRADNELLRTALGLERGEHRAMSRLWRLSPAPTADGNPGRHHRPDHFHHSEQES